MKNIYLVRVNADTTEGRGPMVPKATFTNEQDAIAVEKTMHPYRVDDGLVDVIVFPLYTSIDDYRDNNEKSVKEKALAKLTDYEKKLLGLK